MTLVLFLQFELLIEIRRSADLGAAAVERARDKDSRFARVPVLFAQVSRPGELRVVDDAGREDRCLAQTDFLASHVAGVGAGDQAVLADTVVVALAQILPIRSGQRVIRVELCVEAAVRIDIGARRDDGVAHGCFGEGRRIERYRVNQGCVVDDVPLKIQIERGSFRDGSGQIPCDDAIDVIGLVIGVGIARVEDRIAVGKPRRAAELVGAGFGDDLDAPESEPVIFG